MATARDWLKTLWKASYKGTPFFVENDEEGGGRRIKIHQFPMRDDPYLEDLGEDKRSFDVTAYLASDNVDTDAGALVQTCTTRGAGILVLPTHGPILVRCLSVRRERSKDKHGYIGFRLEFVREGAASALVSTALLANLTYVAADNLAAVASAAFVANIQIANQPDFVVAGAVNGLQDAAATLEAVRTSHVVDPVISSAQRSEIQSIFDQTPDVILDPDTAGTLPQRIVTAARALGDGLDPTIALQTFGDIVANPIEVVIVNAAATTPYRHAEAVNEAEAARVLRLAAIAAYCEAVVRAPLADRPAGITLRANVAEYLEGELASMSPDEIDLYHAISILRDAAIAYLSREVLDLAPVLTVEANQSMPSLFWAWRLYADPNRATEIVARNQVAHPSFIPPKFEALAS